MDDKIFCIDNPILPGAALRTLLLGNEAVLPEVDTTGSEPVATVETENAGALLCSVGTLAWTADISVVKQLGPGGWADVG